MKTLVVDDDLVSRRLMRTLVSAFSDCEVAVNGRDGLQVFEESHRAGKPFDLLCLDVMMPEMDGYELLAAVRAFEERNGIPADRGAKVVIMTAVEDPRIISGAYVAGCQAFVRKPIDLQKLKGALHAAGVILPSGAS